MTNNNGELDFKLEQGKWFINSKKTELQAVTDRVLDEVPQKMSKAIEANFTVWPFYYQYSTEAKMPAENYGKEIERIRELSRKRANLLDRLLK